MACECLYIEWTGDVSGSGEFSPAGLYNGVNYFTFQIEGTDYYIFWDGSQWVFSDTLGGAPILINKEESSENCPTGTWQTPPETPIFSYSLLTGVCQGCTKLQNRTLRKYDSIQLPKIFEEEDRGFFRCCCPYLVLASSSSDTWKNDITSAWIKLSDVSDVVTFKLTKNGLNASYQPTIQNFVREPLGRYVTIDWNDVLTADGEGCYKLEVGFNISGVIQTFTWGIYNLKAYSIQNALKTARIRVKFNSYQEIEQLDFTDTLVEDTFRFYGFIGNSQPNTEIDNLIYDNRQMRKVVRENLNTYELITDPLCEEFITALKDLYLLSENELYISDYNAHNHSYKYQDLPAIVQESPEIEYYDFSRSAKLTCILGDKFKDKRSYFK